MYEQVLGAGDLPRDDTDFGEVIASVGVDASSKNSFRDFYIRIDVSNAYTEDAFDTLHLSDNKSQQMRIEPA